MLKKKLLPLKVELLVILNRFGLIFLWRPQQMWITYPFHLQNWTISLLFKDKKICGHVKNLKTALPPPSISTSWMMLLKDTPKPYNCGSSVEVNDISDSILWNFVWQNATNIYFTKKQLPLTRRILQFQVAHIVIVT